MKGRVYDSCGEYTSVRGYRGLREGELLFLFLFLFLFLLSQDTVASLNRTTSECAVWASAYHVQDGGETRT